MTLRCVYCGTEATYRDPCDSLVSCCGEVHFEDDEDPESVFNDPESIMYEPKEQK